MRAFCLLLSLMFAAPVLADVPFLPLQAVVDSNGIRIEALSTSNGPAAQTLVKSITYRANLPNGKLAFATAGIEKQEKLASGDFLLRFRLQGPLAKKASITAILRRGRYSIGLSWTIRCDLGGTKLNGWTSGYRLEFSRKPTQATTRSSIKWVKPSGAHPWEVKGDTPYPDFEWQVREVGWGKESPRFLAVTSWYDPDWIYGKNVGRAPFHKAVVSAKTSERKDQMVFMVARRANPSPALVAAYANHAPVAFALRTGRLGNLFDPKAPIVFELDLTSAAEKPRRVEVDWTIHDYYGKRIAQEKETVQLQPGQTSRLNRRVEYDKRGILFLSATVRCGKWERIYRTNFAILPKRRKPKLVPPSPFGLAALIANPGTYPDQRPLEEILPLLERIGVHWLRGGVPFKQELSRAEEEATRRRIDLLRKSGIALHMQLGSGLPAEKDINAFKAKVRATLSRFKDASNYIEVGNELNFAHSARDYVKRLLRPAASVTRQVLPKAKVLSMGLGGVSRGWLEDFEKAGGFDWIDVLSIHPGCHPRAPEFYTGWRGWFFPPQLLDARQFCRKHSKEIWITEAYAPSSPSPHALDVRTAADYLVRTYVLSLALGVRVIEWYQFQDGVWFAQIPRPNNSEFNFGMVYTDLVPKPQYVAYGTMTERLEGADCQGRLDLGATDLYGVRFRKNGQTVDVLWSYRFKHETDRGWWPPERYAGLHRRPAEPWETRWVDPVRLFLPARQTVTVTDIMGNQRKIDPDEKGRVAVELTGSPVFVEGLGELPLKSSVWSWPYND